MPEHKLKVDVESQMSSKRETSPQISGSLTEFLLEKQTRSAPAQYLDDFKKQQLEIQRKEIDMTTNESGNHNIPPFKLLTSQNEERLVRVDTTNELYMPLSSTFVLNWKKEMLYILPDFEIGLIIYALRDSGTFRVQ